MSFDNDKLNRVLDGVKDLPAEVRTPLLTNARMTDSDFDVLVTHSTDLEEDFKTEFEESCDIEDIMRKYAESTDAPTLLNIAIKLNELNRPLEIDTVNDALRDANLEERMICVKLFRFEDLSAAGQKVAIKEFIALQKENDTKLSKYEARDELGAIHMNMYRYLATGHLYEKEWYE